MNRRARRSVETDYAKIQACLPSRDGRSAHQSHRTSCEGSHTCTSRNPWARQRTRGGPWDRFAHASCVWRSFAPMLRRTGGAVANPTSRGQHCPSAGRRPHPAVPASARSGQRASPAAISPSTGFWASSRNVARRAPPESKIGFNSQTRSRK